MKPRILIIAALTLLLSGIGWALGLLIGLAVAGFYYGYMRAWEIVQPAPAPAHVEDDD